VLGNGSLSRVELARRASRLSALVVPLSTGWARQRPEQPSVAGRRKGDLRLDELGSPAAHATATTGGSATTV
jgi:hypothetical protein